MMVFNNYKKSKNILVPFFFEQNQFPLSVVNYYQHNRLASNPEQEYIGR